MEITAILFDKDGTLLDFDATFVPATVKVIAELAGGDRAQATRIADAVGFDLENQRLHSGSILISGSLDDIADTLLPLIDSPNAASISKRVDELYIKHSLETVVAFDFLVPTLDALDSMGLALGVATNDSQNGALSHLNRLEVSSRFCFISGFDSGYGTKPEPGMVLAFAKYLGIEPSQIAMVGDSAHDCQSGRAAGALSVGVTSGNALAEDLAPHADHVLRDISALPELISKLNAKGK